MTLHVAPAARTRARLLPVTAMAFLPVATITFLRVTAITFLRVTAMALTQVAAMALIVSAGARAGEAGAGASADGVAGREQHARVTAGDDARFPLTGNINVDLFGLTALRDGPALEGSGESDATGAAASSRKSLWLAAGLSALVPGAGEFYAESYWKAALFVAVEVAAIAIAYSYDRRGDEQTDRYQDFANQHWSVVKYAKFAETLVGASQQFNWRVPGTEGMGEFDRPWTQVNWAELNRMERFIAGYFSHTLPPYGEQQYFELIGKYPQYNQGWDDSPPSFNYGDPLTPRFQFYSGERGKANDLYSNASSWVTVVIINHVLSAVDAAWSAHLHNRASANVGMRMVPTEDGYRPMGQLTVRYSF